MYSSRKIAKQLRIALAFCIFFIVGIAISSCIDSYKNLVKKQDTNIKLWIEPCDSIGLRNIIGGELGQICNFPIYYYGVSNVFIETQGTKTNLESALVDGGVTLDQLVTQLISDLHQNICTETYSVKGSLSYFIYHYDEYEVIVLNDVVETEAMSTALIREIIFCPSGKAPQFEVFALADGTIYTPMANQRVTAVVLNATSSGICLEWIKSEYSESYAIYMDIYWLGQYNEGSWVALTPKNAPYGVNVAELLSSGESLKRLELDWTEFYEELEPGVYRLVIPLTCLSEHESVNNTCTISFYIT